MVKRRAEERDRTKARAEGQQPSRKRGPTLLVAATAALRLGEEAGHGASARVTDG